MHDEIINLRIRVEELEEEVRQLREQLMPSPGELVLELAEELGLWPTQARMLQVLMKYDYVGHELLADAVVGDRDTYATHDTVKVHISRARTLLKAYDVKIHNIYGLGYRISPNDKAKLEHVRKANRAKLRRVDPSSWGPLGEVRQSQ